MSVARFQASFMGSLANRLLVAAREATVLGVTSRGAFLKINHGWVVFLTQESYRGPLTINLKAGALRLEFFRPGMQARVCNGELDLLGTDWVLYFDGAEIWTAPSPAYYGELTPPQGVERLEALQHILIPDNIIGQRSRLLPYLLLDPPVSPGAFVWPAAALGLPEPGPIHKPVENQPATGRQPVSEAGLVDYEALCFSALEACLGLGEGLTPSGDDLVTGFLLAINRSAGLCSWLNKAQLNQALVEAAYRKTNNLSANLIECASLGQADERLLNALDGLVCLQPDLEAHLTRLAGWGNSSGLDALAGMALAIRYSALSSEARFSLESNSGNLCDQCRNL